MVNINGYSSNLKSAAYIGLFFLSLALLVMMAFFLNDAKNKVLDMRTRIAHLDKDMQNLDNVVLDYENNKEKIELLKSTLPETHEEVAYFVRSLEMIAKSENEDLDITIDKTTNDEGAYSSLKFSIKTAGNYTSIRNTLSYLSNLPYHTSIDSLSMEEDGKIVTLTNFRLLMK
jgi:Tfp pilus assembly protein PilO